jgi:hypothetical protein
MNEQCDDVRIVLLGDRLTAGHPIIDLRIALVEQALELAQLLIRELGEMLICKRAYQQIGLLRTAMPSAESELATEHAGRFDCHCRHCTQPRSAISRLVLEIARAGFSPFGQVLVQFMMV